MIFAGTILVVLSAVYCFFVFKRLKHQNTTTLSEKSKPASTVNLDQNVKNYAAMNIKSSLLQKADFIGNILIILFFGFLGTMFIINNL